MTFLVDIKPPCDGSQKLSIASPVTIAYGCMEYKRKVLWLDIDDIALDFIGSFNRWLAQERGYPVPPEYAPPEWSRYEMVPPHEFRPLIDKFIEERSDDLPAFTMPLSDGVAMAAELVRVAHDNGFQVNAITAHPAHKTMGRLANLARHGIRPDAYYSTAHYGPDGRLQGMQKHELARYLSVPGQLNLLVDDRAINALRWVDNMDNGIAVTIDRPYNRMDLLAAPNAGVVVVEDRPTLEAGAALMIFTAEEIMENPWMAESIGAEGGAGPA